MKNLREMAEEMRRSAEVIEQKYVADPSGYYRTVASGNRKIADGLDAGQDAIERLAIAEDLLRGLVLQVVTFDADTDYKAAKRRSWANENIHRFLAGEAVEPLED